MARKSMKLACLFRTKPAPKLLRPCQFLPYCAQANTLSFRKPNHVAFGDDPIQTLRSNQFTSEPKGSSSPSLLVEPDDLLLDYYCNNNGDDAGDGEYCLEELVRGVVRSSERLFFEPNSDTNSLLVVAADERAVSGETEGSKEFEHHQMMIERRKLKGKEVVVVDDDDDDEEEDDDGDDKGEVIGVCENNVFIALESNDPYEDFKKSMKKMVEFHGGVNEWKRLEALLTCYLIVNHRQNHEFIFRAFFDLFSVQ